MRGVVKEYDADLAEWSSRAEREIKHWLRSSGYEVTELPHGKTGQDAHAENGHEQFYVEVERATEDRWATGDYPTAASKYKTLNVLERRAKSGSPLFFVTRFDIRRGLVCFRQSLQPERLTPNPNKLVKKDEYVFKVPLIEVLPIDLAHPLPSSIAVLNAKRIREAYKSAVGRIGKRYVLGEVPPYGISKEEFDHLHLEADKGDPPKALCKCNQNDFSVYQDCGFDSRGYIFSKCRLCGRPLGYRPPN